MQNFQDTFETCKRPFVSAKKVVKLRIEIIINA